MSNLDEMPDSEFKRMMKYMFKEMKKEVCECWNEFQEKLLNTIKKSTQDTKVNFSKEIEILKPRLK